MFCNDRVNIILSKINIILFSTFLQKHSKYGFNLFCLTFCLLYPMRSPLKRKSLFCLEIIFCKKKYFCPFNEIFLKIKLNCCQITVYYFQVAFLEKSRFIGKRVYSKAHNIATVIALDVCLSI